MIVVVGSPIALSGAGGIVAGGFGAHIARAAAASGAAVQVVGRVGEDAAGEQVLLALAASGIGHVAVLREPGRPTPSAPSPEAGAAAADEPVLAEALFDGDDPVDGRATSPDGALPAGLSVDAAALELALRYVPDYRVLVVAADLDPAALEAAVAAAGWSAADLVVLLPDGASAAGLPDATTVLLRPASDPEGSFAAMVAAYAVALDGGEEPAGAFATAQRAGGWAAVAD